MSGPSLLRALLTPLLAAATVLGPPLSAGCHSDEDGLAVTIQAAPLPAALRSFTTDLGYQVTLTRVDIAFAGVELTPCAGARRVARTGVAWAHSAASATRLGESFVVGLDGAVIALGTLGPPPGNYCGLTASLTPADDDALGLPDAAMKGLSLRLEGTYRQGDQPAAPLAVTATLAADAKTALGLTLGDGGVSATTLTVRLGASGWLDGVDLSQASGDEVGRAVLTAVAGSLAVDAQ